MGREGPPPVPFETWDRLPLAEVLNEVIWTNPEIRAPFDMKEGAPTKLGIFVSNEKQERSIKTADRHGRTGVEGAVIFEDVQGRKYRDVDAKGIGHIWYNPQTDRPQALNFRDTNANPNADAEPGEFGLMDRSVALKDASMAEEFLSQGIRTYRVIGITKLNELIAQGDKEEKVSITEAKQRKLITENIEPVVEIRAFGTRARLQDIELDGGLVLLYDAQTLVRKELGITSEQFELKDYLKWLASTLGTNVARMHKRGFIHGYLTRHNITLDCRIVDLDSVKLLQEKPDIRVFLEKNEEEYKHTPQGKYKEDVNDASHALKAFLTNIENITNLEPITDESLVRIFEDAYFDTLRE